MHPTTPLPTSLRLTSPTMPRLISLHHISPWHMPLLRISLQHMILISSMVCTPQCAQLVLLTWTVIAYQHWQAFIYLASCDCPGLLIMQETAVGVMLLLKVLVSSNCT